MNVTFPILSQLEYPERATGLVGAWSPCLAFDTSSTLFDLSGRGNHGTLTNMEMTDWGIVAGRPAITCGGTDEYVTANAAYMSGATQCTVAGWLHVTNTSESGSFGLWTGTVRGPGLFIYNGVRVYSENGNFDEVVISTIGWHHYAIVYNGLLTGVARHRTYMDGRDISSGAFTSAPATLPVVSYTFDCGRESSGGGFRYWQGSYDDILLWSRPLSPAEIWQLYQLGPGGWATPRRRRIYAPQAAASGFKAYWASQRSRILTGGIR